LLALGCLLIAAALVVAVVNSQPGRVAKARVAAKGAAAAASPGAARATIAASGGGPGAPVADLSALTPVQEYNVSGVSRGPVQIGATTYTDSVRFACDSGGAASTGDLDYVVTGYGTLTTIVGMPGDGGAMTVTFFSNGAGPQVSGPVTVSPGHPQRVRVRFRGSSQLEISCSAVDATGPSAKDLVLALGNPTIGPG
jgi:hypothetical protein